MHVGHLKIVGMLLETGGVQNSVNQADIDGLTPLNYACQVKIIEILLAIDGIRVNQADNKGATPLSFACFACSISVIRK